MPGMSAPLSIRRVDGGTDRGQPDHLAGKAGIALLQFRCACTLCDEAGDQMHRDAGATKHRGAAEDLGINHDKPADPPGVP